MREQLESLIGTLLREHQRVERETHRRFIEIRVPLTTPQSHEDFEVSLARACWVLFYPELDEPKRLEEFKPYVLSEAFRLLQREYGTNVRAHAYDRVQSGIKGGFRELLNTLLRLAVADFARLRSRTLVDNYWASTDPTTLGQDSLDYISCYSQIIPKELTENGAGLLRTQFRELLIEHSVVISKLRREIRK